MAESSHLRLLLSVTALIGLSLMSAAGIYLWAQTPSERWLLLCRSDAESYAKKLLSSHMTEKWPPADCLIDVYVATNPKDNTVLFSPHDNHDIAVIYAPGRTSDQIIYEQHVAHRIRQNWYALF